MKNIELYIIVLLIVSIVWLIFNTIKFYRGEKRKVKNLYHYASKGEVEAQKLLAKHYHKGNMVKKDCQRAAFWFQRASFSGDEEAKGHLQKFFDKNKSMKKKC